MKNKFKFSNILLGLVFLVFFVYIFSHNSEINKLPSLISKLNLPILLGLIIIEYLFLANRANIFHFIFEKFDIKTSKLNSLLIFIASYSLNVITPSAGFSGIALYANQAEKLGTSKTKMILSNAVFYFVNYLSIAILLFLSLIYLFFTPVFPQSYLTFLAIIFLVLSLIILVIYIAFVNHKFLNWLITKSTKLIDSILKIFKAAVFDKDKVEKIFEETRILKQTFLDNSKNLWRIISLFFLGNLLEILSLYLILYNFGAHTSLIGVTVVYSVGLLFMLASITPSGIGIVEPIMAWLFTAFGVPIEVGLLTVLIFRAITFWLPIPFGIFIIRKYITE
jgi:hypothetical protein